MSQNQDANMLDPSTSPLLLFHYIYNDPEGESDADSTASSYEGEVEESAQGDVGNHENHDTKNSDNENEPVGGSNETEQKSSNDNDVYDDEEDDKDGEPNDTMFFYNIARGKLHSKRLLDDFKGHFYWITPQGWLLMVHRVSHETFLWNPITSQRVSLPSDQDKFHRKNEIRCLLSHKPTDPNCVVLVVNCRDTVFWYCHPEGNQWSRHTYDSRMLCEKRNGVLYGMTTIVAVGGKFYTHLFTHMILTLDFCPNPEFTTTPVGDKSNHVYPFVDSFLIESRGELFSLAFHQLCYMDMVVHIAVHKLDTEARNWKKVETLGDRVFFVNFRHFGVSLSADEVGLKGNCIYFLRHGDKGLYVYNMERGSITLYNPGKDLQDDVAPEMLMPILS